MIILETSFRRGSPARGRLVLAMLAAGTGFAATPESNTVAMDVPMTHVLFMGADISVAKGNELHPVEDVTDSAFIIRVDGQPMKVPYRQLADIRIKGALKVSGTNVALDGLKAERAYAPGSDPFEKLSGSITMAAGESAVADIAQANAASARMSAVGAGAMLEGASNPAARAEAAQAFGQAISQQEAAESAVAQAHDAQGYGSKLPGQELGGAGEELFDAIRFSFEVTADRDLAQPYYALIAQIRERDGRPGQIRQWAYVKSLGPVTAGSPKKVTVLQDGLPPGYHLAGCEVHLYERGEELSTNLSRRRVPLTDAEALEYRIIEYIGANKEQTLPAALISPPLSETALFSLTGRQLDTTCYVRVGKDGRVTAVFSDAAGRKPVADTALGSVLKALRFKPALESGRPVESIAPITPGQLPFR